MALRLIEMVLPEDSEEAVRKLLAGQPVLDVRLLGLREGEILLRILLQGEKSEAVLDLLECEFRAIWKVASPKSYPVSLFPNNLTGYDDGLAHAVDSTLS